MEIKRAVTEEEEEIIFKAIDEFKECGKTNISCPICNGKLGYVENNSSFSVTCENCGGIKLFKVRPPKCIKARSRTNS